VAPAVRCRGPERRRRDRALLQLGLRDEFIEHGDPARLLSMQGLDAAGIEASIRARFNLPDGQARPVLKVVQS
jgi:1-deoxy-D-xylulose-5-phosphate synthase